MTLDEIFETYPEEAQQLKDGEFEFSTDSPLYIALYNYYMVDMPYGTMKSRDGDPEDFIINELHYNLKRQLIYLDSIF